MQTQLNRTTKDILLSKAENIDKLRLESLLGNENSKQALIKLLQDIQFDNGSFPYNFDTNYPFAMIRTYRAYQFLKELQLDQETAILTKLIDFIVYSQHKEGYWNENTQLSQTAGIPSWLNPYDESIKIFTTAYCLLMLIIEKPNIHRKNIKAGFAFLKQYRNVNYRFNGFLHTSWIMGAAYLGYYGKSYVISREIISMITNIIYESKTNIDHLTWIASSLLHVGYKPNSLSILHETIHLIQALQKNNGFWDSEITINDPSVTINALILLSLADRLKIE